MAKNIESTLSPLPISCYIRTLNEARGIEGVIKAAFKIVDEVIIVDSGSTDGTVDIAEKAGARVIHQDWLGNGHQKCVGERACKHDWLLDLDGDEIVSDELAMQIRELFKDGLPDQSVYRLRLTIVTPFGDVWPNSAHSWRAKLYNKTKHSMPEHKAWDQLELSFKPQKLDALLLHYAFADIKHLTGKLNGWAALSAQESKLKPYGYLAVRIVAGFPVHLFQNYIMRRLWYRGLYGFVVAWTLAHGRWLRDVRMLEMHLQARAQNKNKNKNKNDDA